VTKIWLKQVNFCNIWLMSGLAKFYETNKIQLNQAKYIHLPITNLVNNEIENVS